MAKRTVQLQTELLTDEDFDSYLMTSGLLVIEVYSEWCGPCLGIVNSLRRLKYDVGDGLNFATAKADTISYVHRFYKRSEPVWLFVKDGRALNIMFGTNTPQLLKLIRDEISLLPKFHQRETYNISELLPEEEKQNRIKNEAKDMKLREEKAAKERKKADYFAYVTDTIMENLPDIGVTVFGPHLHRDLFRKLMDFGFDKLGIQCKDRRNQSITKEQFEIINTVCPNPISADVIDVMDDKELFICFWKVPDDKSKRTIPEILELYADEVMKSHTLPPDEYRDTEEIRPALVSPLKMVIEYELPDDQECPAFENEQEPEIPKKGKLQNDSLHEDIEATIEDHFSEMGSEEDEELPEEPKQQQSINDMDFLDFDLPTEVEEEEEIIEGPKKNICKKILTIPGIWVPKDHRTHAALIYVLFRQHTLSFLPPDPVPEPPHVIMAFNTYKQRDLIDFAERYKDDIPSYGYFTSDDYEEAKFIASSKQSYAHSAHSATDKLVFKVNKRTSHTMLSLVSYGPTYVSFNTTVGKEEALKFFPENYSMAEQDLIKMSEETKDKKTKKAAKDKKDKQQEEAMAKNVKEDVISQQEKEDIVDEKRVEEGKIGEEELMGEGEGGTEGRDIGEGKEIPPDTVQEPTATEPPTTEPPTTEPPTTEPPTTEPPTTEPPTTEPPTTEPPTTEPPTAEPPTAAAEPISPEVGRATAVTIETPA